MLIIMHLPVCFVTHSPINSPTSTKTHTAHSVRIRMRQKPARYIQKVAIFTSSIHVAEAARCAGVPPLWPTFGHLMPQTHAIDSSIKTSRVILCKVLCGKRGEKKSQKGKYILSTRLTSKFVVWETWLIRVWDGCWSGKKRSGRSWL